MKPTWHGVDLRWAYSDLLAGIQRSTGCAQQAYDVLHDSLVRLALVNRKEPPPSPHAYLRVVVRNVLADRYRERARWAEWPEASAADGERLDAAFEPAPSAEHLADLEQRLRLMQHIMDCLPPRCREVFWYFCVEGYHQPQIAEKLGISLKAVERHVMRALIDIRAARQELMG